MVHGFRLPRQRFDYLKLPCLSRDVNGIYKARNSGFNSHNLVVLRGEIILAAVRNYEPDLLLIDKKPLGLENELASTLAYVHEELRSKVALVLRDILDSPETTTRIWLKNNYFQAIERLYDRILVVGSEDIFDIRKEYAFPPKVADKVRFCGYIRCRIESNGLDNTVLFEAVKGKKLILVTPGGGEDGFLLLKNYMNGLDQLRIRGALKDDIVNLLVTGPEMPQHQIQALKSKVDSYPGVIVREFISGLPALIKRADLVVSMAGYNTSCEVLSLKKRAVVVPRVKPVAEQWIRAQRFADRGLIHAIHPQELTPTVLMESIRRQLHSTLRSPSVRPLDFSGLSSVTREIRELLSETEENVPARSDFAGIDTEPEERECPKLILSKAAVHGF